MAKEADGMGEWGEAEISSFALLWLIFLARICMLWIRKLATAVDVEAAVLAFQVVTWDDDRESDGIKIVPAWKWCMEEG